MKRLISRGSNSHGETHAEFYKRHNYFGKSRKKVYLKMRLISSLKNLALTALPLLKDFLIVDDQANGEIDGKFEYYYDYDVIPYSFEVSDEFAEYNSGNEADPCFVYDPNGTDGKDAVLDKTPYICICSDDDVYKAVMDDVGTGNDCEILNNRYFAFKTSKTYMKKLIMYGYAFKKGTARENEFFCAIYPKEEQYTSIGRKMRAEMDRVAESYAEGRVAERKHAESLSLDNEDGDEEDKA